MIPEAKPPMWAAYATPPAFRSLPLKLINWIMIQKPSTKIARIFIILKKIINQKKTLILAFGNKTTYAPNKPAMAPDAPTIGIVDVGSKNAWDNAAHAPVIM